MYDTLYHRMSVKGQGLKVKRGGMLVFEGVDFTLESGELLILTGPNGSGKSSLIRTLAGFVGLEAGHLSVEIREKASGAAWQPGTGGHTIAAILPDLVHYAGHQDGLKSALSLRTNSLDWGLFVHGITPNNACLEAAADAFDLAPLLDREIRYFSSGQRHRASLMKLLLGRRPVWLLDEPTVGLDRESRALLAEQIKAHLVRGGLVVAATHEDLGIEEGTPESPRTKRLNMGDFRPAVAAFTQDKLEEEW